MFTFWDTFTTDLFSTRKSEHEVVASGTLVVRAHIVAVQDQALIIQYGLLGYIKVWLVHTERPRTPPFCVQGFHDNRKTLLVWLISVLQPKLWANLSRTVVQTEFFCACANLAV